MPNDMKEVPASFDLGSFDTKTAANEGVEFELISLETNEGSGFFITVYGQDSDVFQKTQRMQGTRKVKQAVAARGQVKVSSEDIEEDSLELLGACTKAWRTASGAEVSLFGRPFPCTPENAIELYQRVPYIRRQVEEAIRNQANFIKRSVSH